MQLAAAASSKPELTMTATVSMLCAYLAYLEKAKDEC